MLDYLLKTLWGFQAFVGAIFNYLALSFFYHISRSKEREGRETFLSSMLLILASLDLFACFIAMGRYLSMTSALEGKNENLGFTLFTTLLFLSADITAFLTCIMTVTRTIGLLKPRYVVNRKLVYFSIFVYNVVMVTSSGMFKRFPTEASLAKFLILVSILASVVMSNIVCIYNLRQTRTTRWKRRATVTVAILSLVFCVTNIGYIGFYGWFSFAKSNFEIPYIYRAVFMSSLLPFNSAINPIVLIMRTKKMKSYLQQMWTKFFGFFRELCHPVLAITQNENLELRSVDPTS